MKSRIFKLSVCALMAVSMVGCSSGTTAATSTSSSSSASGSGYTVKLCYTNLASTPSEEATKGVEDAINSYLAEKGYDFNLDIQFTSISDYQTTIPLSLSSSTEADIVWAQDLTSMVSNGYLIDLTPYLDNELKDANALLGDWVKNGQINGTTYAIPNYKGLSLSWKYIYNKDMVDAVGYDMSTVTDFESLKPLFAAIKEKYPDAIVEADSSRYPALYNSIYHNYQVGTYFSAPEDSTTLEVYFNSDAFKEACKTAYEFRQLGYTSPEGSTNTNTADVLVTTGAAIGTVMGHSQTEDATASMFNNLVTTGEKFGAKQIQLGQMESTGYLCMWGIPYTSKNPSAAATMLNLIWTDPYILNTLEYGVEGRDYEWDADHTYITYPEGVNAGNVQYNTALMSGVLGNEFNLYDFKGSADEADYYEENNTFKKTNMENAYQSPLFGFTPDASNVSTQIAAISNVYNQYYNALVYGDVDPDEKLPEFLNALDQAGIQDVLKEYQSQVDAWVSAN
ncbi:MAG: ABC transporter substrate-binding protein [Solobacterium sp.]|jgi:putative aldouronate transport system substrate-binding protein|nr:ABC transporter substrate-binding protein [Solobacterium sp.]